MLRQAIDVRREAVKAAEARENSDLRPFTNRIEAEFRAATKRGQNNIEININFLTIGDFGLERLRKLLLRYGYGVQVTITGTNVANLKICV